MNASFNFAGFTWPRKVATMPKGSLRERLRRMHQPRTVGDYMHAPAPIRSGKHPGKGIYLDMRAVSEMRFIWCDELDKGMRHSGYYTTEDGSGDLMRGIVVRLPNRRGFLYGWSLGDGMATCLTGDVWPEGDEIGAAMAADACAQEWAEKEREYQARWSAAIALDDEISTACNTLRAYRRDYSAHLAAWLDAKKKGAKVAAGTLSCGMAHAFDNFRQAAKELRALREKLGEFADVER